MSELTKLEVGKTYVFKDDEAKEDWLSKCNTNKILYRDYYKEGFKLTDAFYYENSGYINRYEVISKSEVKYFKLKEGAMENKHIKPEDIADVKFTYAELAQIYAIMGSYTSGTNLWEKIKCIIDPHREIYDYIIDPLGMQDLKFYNRYKAEWLSALFPQPSVESETQRQVRELREQAEELLAKAKVLEESLEV